MREAVSRTRTDRTARTCSAPTGCRRRIRARARASCRTARSTRCTSAGDSLARAVTKPGPRGPGFFRAPGRAHALGGESPLHTRQGEVLAEGKGVAGDCESEGSPRQSAGLTNRKRIEAVSRGEAAKKVEARYLHGTR